MLVQRWMQSLIHPYHLAAPYGSRSLYFGRIRWGVLLSCDGANETAPGELAGTTAQVE